MNAMSPPPRLLPVWIVVRRSFAYAWESRRVLAVPYLVYVAITVVVDLSLAASGNQAGAAFSSIVDEVFGMSFAVAVQRYVLLGEAGRGIRFFRWDAAFIRYLVNALLLGMAIALTMLFLVGLFENVGAAMGAIDPETGLPDVSPRATALEALFAVPAVAIAVAVSRLVLTLPAAALGQADRLRTIWAATAGNGWRLLAVSFFVLLPFAAVEGGLLWASSGAAADSASASTLQVAIAVVTGFVAPLQLIVSTVMLALEYDALVRGGGPPAASRSRNIRAVN